MEKRGEKMSTSALERIADESGIKAIGTVLVIDDHPLFCEALSMTLTGALGARELRSGVCLADGLAILAGGCAPDVIFLDLNLPDVTGVDGLLRIRAAAAGAPVIVVSSMSDNRIVASAMRAGAAGFIPKDSSRDDMVVAIRSILAGDAYTPRGFVAPAEVPDGGATDDDALSRLADLTPQQYRILELVCEGKLNKQIAFDLSIAETTVKAHITAILRKLKVHSRTQAVLIAQKAHFARILRREAEDS